MSAQIIDDEAAGDADGGAFGEGSGDGGEEP